MSNAELRNMLAASALDGILSGAGACWRDGAARPSLTPKSVATLAVEYADATLLALGYGPPGCPPAPLPGRSVDAAVPFEADSEGGEV